MKEITKVLFNLSLITKILCQWTRNGVPVVENSRTNRSISGKAVYSDSYIESCISTQNKLLSNLYVDYFRSSGPCKMEDDSIIYTFQKHKQKMTSEKLRKTMEKLCKSLPVLCDKRR
ncbi:hypothetical protein Avbf_03225 [Armadillidium vulgare]|nr:hypothetical protein Avbf_03225 [Armadillidium vulgare]